MLHYCQLVIITVRYGQIFMNQSALKQELEKEYEMRFSEVSSYRAAIWKVLTASFFQRFLPPNSTVLDLGCGWGEFINHITAQKKYGMDLNPSSKVRLNKDIEFLNQDCSEKWAIPGNSLDVVFTSNFFEHLPTKDHLKKTLQEAYRCLKPGGQIICLGPNIKYLPGLYWDFWDHYIELTELSLKEVLELNNYRVETCIPRFLPYTMVNATLPPLLFVKLFLKLPFLWRFFGKQFLVIARK